VKILPISGLSSTLLIFVASLVHPFGPVKQERTDAKLNLGAPPGVARMLERACQNCHSERTEWPWYSYLAPASWAIEKDVSSARAHMNLSRWQDYSIEQRTTLLTMLAVEVRNRNMPLPKYLKLHPEAKLSDEDVQQLYSWAHSERGRLRAADTKGKAGTD
jgi:Haem-binding domain